MMDQAQDFKSMQDLIQASLIATTRTAGQVSAEDLGFQRSLNPAVGTLLDEQGSRLLTLARDLLKSATSISELKAPTLGELDDVDTNWRGVVDVVDSLLEKADTSLDEYTGVIKRRDSPNPENTTKSKKNLYSLGSSFRTQNILKPQLNFKVKPTNHDATPWRPLLTSKPHATLPLEQSLGTFTDELDHKQYDYTSFLNLALPGPSGQNLGGLSPAQRARKRASARKRRKNLAEMGSVKSKTNNIFRYRHPYETEILHLDYPVSMYQKADPIPYLPVDKTSATFVDTYEGVLEMLKELKTATEIAVDLEHHDARSYIGLVSLMQISTRQKDWIVDTLKPWRQELQVLNEVFADPKIIKVFHGAYMDIVWLQRDLGLYVVGLFDTHHACRTLGYPGGSLAYLLKRFINFDADKKYQMADWRIRPLPEEMFFYARSDTHFLLYIFDNLRNELIDRTNASNPEENRIEIVLQKSKETSLLRFERPIYDEETGKGPGGWYGTLSKAPTLLTNEQFSVYKAVHAWRDQIARKDDDSTHTVMPNHVILSLAKAMPTELAALYGAVHPISYNVKSRITELLSVIKAAKAAGVNGPSLMEVLRPDSVGAAAKAAFSGLKGVTNGTAPRSLLPSLNDDASLRSETSSFWGRAFGSSLWEPSSASVANGEGLRLAVPLPPLSSDAFTSSTEGMSQQTQQVDTPGQNSEEAEKAVEEPFTVRGGRKRKSEAISAAEESDDLAEPTVTGKYDISLNDEDEQKAVEKAARKAERKAQKKLKKAQKKAVGDGSAAVSEADRGAEDEEEEEEAFDYSKAETVLHAKRAKDENGSKRKKAFDPYAKSADAPKGMRRLQTERPGKSFTFKK